MNTRIVLIAAACAVLTCISSTHAMTIDTVPVGNAGNAADSTGYGAVSYEYKIGKFEVTAGQYRNFLNAVAATDTYGLYNTSMDSNFSGCQIQRTDTGSGYSYSVASDYANRPVNFVSWGDAARFANWLHNGQPTGLQGLSTTEDGAYFLNGATTDAQLLAVTRETDWKWAITSEDEWYKGAYYSGTGSVYYDYPTGTDISPSNDLIDPDPGNNANFRYDDGGYTTIGSPYWRTPVGEFENSESPYGTFDQGGNVWEWNEAILYGSYRGLRGGSFLDNDSVLHASSTRDINISEDVHSLVGFRVVHVPEPATLGMMLVGVLALLRGRGRFEG